jgi:HSP20 family protein
MAEKQTDMTRAQDERRLRQGTASGWGVSPFRALQRMAEEMDHLLDDFGGRGWTAPRPGDAPVQVWAPDVEVFQKDNELTIKADLPGLKKDEVSVNVTDEAVTIQGERKRDHEEERDGFYRTERSYGSFQRVIPLPDGVMCDQAKATFHDGVLEIRMPAAPKSRGRRLEISETKPV